MDELFSAPIAAQLADCKEVTLRAWRNRNGFLRNPEGPGKRRRYSMPEVLAIRLMVVLTSRGIEANMASAIITSILPDLNNWEGGDVQGENFISINLPADFRLGTVAKSNRNEKPIIYWCKPTATISDFAHTGNNGEVSIVVDLIQVHIFVLSKFIELQGYSEETAHLFPLDEEERKSRIKQADIQSQSKGDKKK